MRRMSPAQYTALRNVIDRDDQTVARYTDTSTVKTLIAMDKRRWVTLVWDTVDGRPQITSAVMTKAGRVALADEEATRAREAERAAFLASLEALRPAPVEPAPEQDAPVILEGDQLCLFAGVSKAVQLAFAF